MDHMTRPIFYHSAAVLHMPLFDQYFSSTHLKNNLSHKSRLRQIREHTNKKLRWQNLINGDFFSSSSVRSSILVRYTRWTSLSSICSTCNLCLCGMPACHLPDGRLTALWHPAWLWMSARLAAWVPLSYVAAVPWITRCMLQLPFDMLDCWCQYILRFDQFILEFLSLSL